ncbi:MAG: hypothetical protein QOE70_247 [Chthoniobacter sp.]|jgi:hypothetical protein|nr:hypothetical protein [Chthoniobacter sp.]
MQNDALLFIRIIFTGLFIVTVFVGVYLAKNFEKLFGVDPNMPSENGSSRAYSRVQIFSIWAHAFFLTAAFALLVH